jgi:S1-C subfamily serine protease
MKDSNNMETVTSESPVKAFSNQLADAVERAAASLVLVNGRQRQPASGIIFDAGLVLTADHVLEREEDLTILSSSGETLPAQFAGRDLASDLAVLRVPNLTAPAASLSEDKPRVGQLVLAVGRPSAEGPMASIGIISAVGGPLRTRQGITLEKFIQTDAIPYPGFSGGPLIDPTGAVLGVLTTAIVSSVALAIPAAQAWQVARTLAQQGFIKRGYLGISIQPVQLPASQRAGGSQERGLVVLRVEENSPAQQSGLLIGDILVKLDGQPATDSEDIQALLTGEKVGKPVATEVIRGDKLVTLQVTVGQRA